MAATLKVPTIFTAVDKFSSVFKTMTKGVKTWSSKSIAAVQRFDQKVSKAFRKLSGFARAGLGLGAGLLARGGLDIVKNYEQAVADLSAVMNTTTQNQRLLSKDAERLGSITAKSATQVVGLQEAFARLGFTTPQIINMTQSTISGSVAMNAELSDTAELVGAMVKTFDNFSSIDAPKIIDKLTLSTQKSALNFEKLQTALPIVSGAANAAKIPFEKLLALLGKLSDSGIDASSSSTALRNIFLESAKQGLNFSQILAKIEKNQNKLTAANDQFGKRGAVSATILSGKLKEVDKLTETLTNNFKGTAGAAEATRLDTFSGSVTLLQSALEGLLIRQNQTTGALNKFRNVIDFVTKNIESIANIIIILISSFLAMKAVVLAVSIVTGAYNIALGIMGAVSGSASIAIGANTIALTAYKIATVIATASQWLLNAALNANPIGLIVIAIFAVSAVIMNWGSITDWFSKKWKKFTAFISKAWKGLGKLFRSINFKSIFKNIGQSILKFVLMPIRAILKLLSNLPGKVGRLASKGLESVNKISGIEEVKETIKVLPSPEVAASRQTTESIQRGTLDININDKNGNVESTEQTGNLDIPIKVEQTQGAF